tara:strand:- start:2334 stop:4043 length:1710 start_codon:yes stop_codon:yes gene_type:complete
MPKDTSIAIGIDLGTTYSCISVWKNGKTEVIPNDQGNRTTPSYVAFTDSERLIGESAKNQAAMNPNRTLYDVKRIIGRTFKDLLNMPFTILKGDNNEMLIDVDDKKLLPEEISAMILSNLKEAAEAHLGQIITKAVITVPAYFNDKQRMATKQAGEIAGLEVLRILNEPTAAAIAYGLEKKSKQTRNILIFDLGGGTFDVTILIQDDGLFTVKSTSGNTRLGGEDFDDRIVSYLISKHALPISENFKALRRLRNAVECAKRALSETSQTSIDIESLYDGKDFESILTRAKFEDICSDLFVKTITCVERALHDSKLKKRDISDIVLVGGSTRIPKVQLLLSEFFDNQILRKSINPDEAVACGAAVSAFVLNGGKSKETDELLLVDVCPLSIGVETAGGVMDVIVKRNTIIPTKRTKTFTTFEDNQTSIDIDIFEGERTKTSDCHKLGSFKLEGITPEPLGKVRIDVEIDIDTNSIVKVAAVEQVSGITNNIIVNTVGNLTPKEVEQMIKNSEEYASKDKRIRERIIKRNELEQECLEDDNEITREILEWLENNPNASIDEYKCMFDLLDE